MLQNRINFLSIHFKSDNTCSYWRKRYSTNEENKKNSMSWSFLGISRKWSFLAQYRNPRTKKDQSTIKFELSDGTGLGPTKILKCRTGPRPTKFWKSPTNSDRSVPQPESLWSMDPWPNIHLDRHIKLNGYIPKTSFLLYFFYNRYFGGA